MGWRTAGAQFTVLNGPMGAAHLFKSKDQARQPRTPSHTRPESPDKLGRLGLRASARVVSFAWPTPDVQD